MDNFNTDKNGNESICNINNFNHTSKQNRVFFNLTNSELLQKVLINTLLTKNNCIIDDLAILLNIDPNQLHQVWQGNAKLTEKKSKNLINLFYILSK